MKKITLFLTAIVLFCSSLNAQNLLKNGGFEDDVSTFTAKDGDLDVLMRVNQIQDAKTQIANPKLDAAVDITEGLWIKKAPNSGYIKAVIVTSEKHEGTSALHMQSRANNAATGLTNWYQFIAQQKISGGLDNSKKYVAKFWARVDDTANNVCDKVVVFITDNTAKVNITKTIELTGGTTWTEYTTPEFDLPAHIAENSTADFSVAYFGIGNPTTYKEDEKTNYSGVFIDDVSLADAAAPEETSGIVYVKPGGTGDGSSWENAMGDIQAGISAANALDPKGEVWVKAGTYTVTTTVSMSQGVNVYGGFAGTETSKEARVKGESGKPWDFVNETIVDGGGAVRPMEVRGNFEVETILDGFTMTNGNGKSTGNLDGSGGGLVLRPGFKVQNCIIKNNAATGGGGGITATGGSLINSYIYRNNQSVNNNGGGGIHVNTLEGMETIIDNCTFEGNSSTKRGGGLNVQGKGFTKMSNLVIFNNSAEDKPGGAIYQNSPNNSAFNLLVYNNTGTSAIQLQGTLLNSTIVNNIGGIYIAGAGTIEISNNIVWGCETIDGAATGITGSNANATVENNGTYTNIVEGNYKTTANNIKFSSNNSNGDVEEPAEGTVGSGPKFNKVSTFKGFAKADEEILILDSVNWSLQGASPCIDAGKTLTDVTTDIVGLARPQGAAYEMGAYEYDPTITDLSKNEFIYSVYSKDNKIIISGFDQAVKVAVYSITGQTVYNRMSPLGSSIEIPVQKGIYIVRVNNTAKKVIVR